MFFVVGTFFDVSLHFADDWTNQRRNYDVLVLHVDYDTPKDTSVVDISSEAEYVLFHEYTNYAYSLFEKKISRY